MEDAGSVIVGGMGAGSYRKRPRRLKVAQVEQLLRPDRDTLTMLEGITSGKNVPRNAGAIVRGIGLRLEYSQPKPAVRIAGADGEPLRVQVDLTAAVAPRVEELKEVEEYPVPVKVFAPGKVATPEELRAWPRYRGYDSELRDREREDYARAEAPEEERPAPREVKAVPPIVRKKASPSGTGNGPVVDRGGQDSGAVPEAAKDGTFP